MGTNEIKNKIDEIRRWEEKIKQKDLKYKTNKHFCDLHTLETIKSFGDILYTGNINIDEAEMDQTNLLEYLLKFDNKSKPKSKERNDKKSRYL